MKWREKQKQIKNEMERNEKTDKLRKGGVTTKWKEKQKQINKERNGKKRIN